MTHRSIAALLLAACTGGLLSCAPATNGAPWSNVREVTPAFLLSTPAGSRAADASLALDDRGRIALTWVTRDTVGADLWLTVSADSGAHWSAALRVNTRPGKVSSYPESRPVATWDRSGMLVVAWASARDSGQYADDIAVRVSADGGRVFGEVTLVNSDHADSLSTYHGFVALTMLPDGRPYVAWIDGRAQAGLGDEPTRAEIRASTSRDGGASWTADTLIARDVCPCCHIALASSMRETGAIDIALAYRGAADDLRDPRLAVSHDGGDTFALDTLVSADRWKLLGCPSVGPALTMDMGGGHYAWFTGESPDDDSLNAVSARPAPGVYLVPWRIDAGATGPKRALADSLGDPSRPMLARLESGTLVGAIGAAASGPARKVLAVRRLELDGVLSPWLYLGSGVKSGAIAAQGDRAAWAAWTEGDKHGTRVRVVRLTGR